MPIPYDTVLFLTLIIPNKIPNTNNVIAASILIVLKKLENATNNSMMPVFQIKLLSIINGIFIK